MTKDAKWAIAGVGFFFSFFIGWGFPLVWLAYVILLIILLLSSTSQCTQSVSAARLVVAGEDKQELDLSELQKQLERDALSARNTDVGEGLALALKRLKQFREARAYQKNTAQSAVLQPNITTPLSELDIALERAKQEERNTNVLLYVACFLLVGAAALFIGFSNIGHVTKFVLLLLVAVTFYGAGLWMHQAQLKLRQAAVAFVGTGLALLPFAGLAFYNYVIHDGSLAWWLTSAVGVLGFWIALIKIRSQLLPYLTLAFILSLATSSVSMLQVPFMWYFVALIIMSSLFAYISYKKPGWLPTDLQAPLDQNAQIVAPLALVGSVLLGSKLNALDLSLISAVGALHYAVSSLHASKNIQYLYVSAARGLAIVFALFSVQHFTNNLQWVGLVLAISALLTHAYSTKTIVSEAREYGWLWFSQVSLVVASAIWWDDLWNVCIGLLLLAIVSVHQLYVMKRTEVSVLGLLALGALPVVGRVASESDLGLEVVATAVFAMAVVCMSLRLVFGKKHQSLVESLTAGYVLYSVEALVLGILSGEGLWIGGLLLCVSLLLYGASFIEKQPGVHAVSNTLTAMGVYILFDQSSLEKQWLVLATAITTGLIWYALRWYFAFGQIDSDDPGMATRQGIMRDSTVVVLLLGGIYSTLAHQETVVAGCVVGVIVAGLLAYEGYVKKDRAMQEMAVVIATLSLQRLVEHLIPNTNVLVYTHWWALVIGTLTFFRLKQGDRLGAKKRGIVALIALSVPTGLMAVSEPGVYRTVFLAEHVLLLAAGFLQNTKLVVTWAAISIGVALLWMLQGYTFFMLFLIALCLIGLAIWRLNKK